MLQWYMGRFALSAAEFSLTPSGGGGPYTVSISAGDYYLRGYDSEATAQLCEHIQEQIRAAGGGAVFASATVTVSATTGCVTIDFARGSGSVTLTWSGTELRDLLGFGGAGLTGYDSYTAGNVARYQWRPSAAPDDYSAGDLKRWWHRVPRSTVYRSGDGSISRVNRTPLWDCEIAYQLLPTEDVMLEDGVGGYQPFEQFFADIIDGDDGCIRCYPDATDLATYYESVVVGEDGKVEPFPSFAKRYFNEYDGRWNVRLHFAKHIAAS